MSPSDRYLAAQRYAEEVRQRNTPPCQCETCVMLRTLPAVQRILANWQQAR